MCPGLLGSPSFLSTRRAVRSVVICAKEDVADGHLLGRRRLTLRQGRAGVVNLAAQAQVGAEIGVENFPIVLRVEVENAGLATRAAAGRVEELGDILPA